MRRLFNFTTALALTAGLLFTSCLGNTEESPYERIGGSVIASTMYGQLVLTMEDGSTLIPDATVALDLQDYIDKTSPRIFLVVQVLKTDLKEQQALPANQRKFNFSKSAVIAGVSMSTGAYTTITTHGAASDTLASKCNSNIISVDTLYINGYDGYMRMNVNYPCGRYVTPDLTLFRYTDEPVRHGATSAVADTVDVYLGLDAKSDSYPESTAVQIVSEYFSIPEPDYRAAYFYYKAFNIRPIVEYSERQSEELILKIHAKVSASAGTEGQEKIYTVKYSGF